MRGVGSNAQRRGRRRRAASTGSGVGELDTTSQCAGAVTVKRKRRLQVGLLEHGEHAARVGHLELRVEVDLVVDRVDEAVQALAGVHVAAVGDDDELVLGGEVRQLDAHAVAHLGRVERAPLRVTECTVRGDRVDEGRRALGSAVNRTVVVLRNISAPVVRSSATS